MLGLCLTIHLGGTMPLAAGQMPWQTAYLGPTLVLLPAGCAVGLGLITLWIGLAIQRRSRGTNPTLATSRNRTPAAAIAAMAGCNSQLMSVDKGTEAGRKGAADAASFLLQVPSLSGPPEVLPVVANRPSVGSVVQGWLSKLQQLPRSSPGKNTSSSKGSDRMYCVVYGCGPTPLDHDTQLAVAAVAAKQKSQVMLQFVRKAQML